MLLNHFYTHRGANETRNSSTNYFSEEPADVVVVGPRTRLGIANAAADAEVAIRALPTAAAKGNNGYCCALACEGLEV